MESTAPDRGTSFRSRYNRVVGVELALAEGAVPIEDDGGGEESPGPGDATGGEATPDRGP